MRLLSKTSSMPMTGRTCAPSRLPQRTRSSIPKTTSCSPHRRRRAKPRRPSSPSSPSFGRTRRQPSGSYISARSRPSSTINSSDSTPFARKRRSRSGDGTETSPLPTRRSFSKNRAASCKSHRNRLRRYCSTVTRRSGVCLATCATSLSTKFTPCCGEIAVDRPSAS